MIKTDNPAGRLHEILEAAKAHTGNGFLIWAKVFDIPITSDQTSAEAEYEITSRLIQIRKMIDEIEEGLRSIEGINLDLFLRPFSRIRHAIRIGGLHASNYETSLRQITEGDMTVLAFCAEELSKWQSEKTIEEAQIKDLTEDIQALYEQVHASELNAEIKNLILDQLEIIRRAIHEYRIRGVKRLNEALTTVVGAYILNKDLIDEESDKEEVSKFKDTLSKFTSTVAFASHTTRLLEAATTYLPKLLPGG
jgi:hypothetical protein